jgi:hypothetical protein
MQPTENGLYAFHAEVTKVKSYFNIADFASEKL